MNQYRYKPKAVSFLFPLLGLVVTLIAPFLSQRRSRVPLVEEVKEELTQEKAERLADKAVVKAERAKKYVAEAERIRKPRGGGIGRFIIPTIFMLGVRWLLTPPQRQRRRMMAAQPMDLEEATQARRETQAQRTAPKQQEQERPFIAEQPMQRRTEAFNYPTTRQETRQAVGEAQPREEQPDDLKVIEGIGPAIAKHLNNRGIRTFSELAEANQQMLEDILAEEGIRQLSDPHTWPEQARLAANGQWDELRNFQRELKAGKEKR